MGTSSVSMPQNMFARAGSWYESGNLGSSFGLMDSMGYMGGMFGTGLDGGFIDPSFMAAMTHRGNTIRETYQNETDTRQGVIYQNIENYCRYLEAGYEQRALKQYEVIKSLIAADKTYGSSLLDKDGKLSAEKLHNAVYNKIAEYAFTTRNKSIEEIIDGTDSSFMKNLKISRDGFDDTANRYDLYKQLTGQNTEDNLTKIGGIAGAGLKGAGAVAGGTLALNALTGWALTPALKLLGTAAAASLPWIGGAIAIGLIGYGLYSFGSSLFGGSSSQEQSGNQTSNTNVRTDNTIPYPAALQGGSPQAVQDAATAALIARMKAEKAQTPPAKPVSEPKKDKIQIISSRPNTDALQGSPYAACRQGDTAAPQVQAASEKQAPEHQDIQTGSQTNTAADKTARIKALNESITYCTEMVNLGYREFQAELDKSKQELAALTAEQ